MSRLHSFKVKDCDRDSCEHCGLEYWKSVEIRDLGSLRCKVHCDPCIEAERSLDRICNVMDDTQRKMKLLSKKQEVERTEYEQLLNRQRTKMKIVLDNIRKFTKEHNRSTRMPYKE